MMILNNSNIFLWTCFKTTI